MNEVEALVNKDWLNKKKQNDFLLVCLQKDGNTYKNTEKNIKIEREGIEVKNNGYNSYKQKKIKKDNNDLLKMLSQKYALFEITIKKNMEVGTLYLYCSDIESTTNNGMFENCNSIKNVSVGDGRKIKDISKMFYNLNNLVYVYFEYLEDFT